MINRATLLLAKLLAFFMISVSVLAALAVWRLASGPVSLEPLTPTLARALDDAVGAAGTLHTSVADTVLIWGGFDHPLELRLREVTVDGADGHPIVRIPELAVGLSLRSLARGRLALARLAVIHPTLHLERTPEGRLMLDLDGGAPAGKGPALTVNPEAAEAGDPLAAFLAALRRPAGEGGALAALTQVSIQDAALTLEDRVTGAMWTVPKASMTAKRGADGLSARLRVELPVGPHAGLLEVNASERAADGAILASLKLRDVDAGVLASALPALAPFTGSRLPVSGGVEAIFDGELRPLRLRLSLTDAGPGELAGPTPLKLGSLALAAVVEPGAGRFTLEQARLTLADPALSLAASGRGEHHGGDLQLTLAAGQHSARIDAKLTPVAAGSDLALTLAGFEPGMLAGLVPALAPLALPLSGTLHLALAPDWSPGRLAIDLTAAAGRLVPPPALLAEPIAVRAATLRLAASRERLEIETVAVDLGGPVLSAEGAVIREGERLAIRGGVKVKALPVDSLAKLWPAPVGRHAREWITQRVSAGTIDEAWIGVDGGAPLSDPSAILATSLDAGLAASNLTVAYFKTLAPITGISGRGSSDGRELVITTSGGHVLDMALGEARLVFSKLDTPQEWLDIDAPLSGSFRSALQVLDTAPLGYAGKVGIDPAHVRGSQTARLHFYLPLKRGLDIDAVEIHADATLHGAAAEGVAGRIAVSEGELKLDIDNAGMNVDGAAKLDGIPATVKWRENFTDGADPQTHVVLKGDIGEAAVAARLPALKPRLGGTLGADVVVAVDKSKRTTVSTRLDLAHARVALPELNWLKHEGERGTASFAVTFEKGHSQWPFRLGLDGAGLKVAGGGVYDSPAGALQRLSLDEVKGGGNDFKLEVKARPDHSLAIALTGASLDARPLLSTPGDAAEKRKAREARLAKRAQPREPGPRYDLSLQAARVVTGDQGRALTGLKGKLRNDGAGWDSIELEARVAGSPAGFSVRYLPAGGRRVLSVTSEDAGAVLRALDLTDSVQGGTFSLTGSGEPGIPAHPVTGRLEVGEFKVVGAPLLARLLSALSVTGLLDLLNGEGLAFSQLAGDLTWSDDTLELTDVRTSGGALGLTVGGTVDLAADTLALEGTIVPVYGLNRILGLVPVLGDLLSGGKGQGLFAATYHLTGSAAEPDISVNPLAVLAPGFLRNLFFLN